MAAGISPRVESRVSDEDPIGEKNKWHMRGAETAVWEVSSGPEQRKKEALRGTAFIIMLEEYFARGSVVGL